MLLVIKAHLSGFTSPIEIPDCTQAQIDYYTYLFGEVETFRQAGEPTWAGRESLYLAIPRDSKKETDIFE